MIPESYKDRRVRCRRDGEMGTVTTVQPFYLRVTMDKPIAGKRLDMCRAIDSFHADFEFVDAAVVHVDFPSKRRVDVPRDPDGPRAA